MAATQPCRFMASVQSPVTTILLAGYRFWLFQQEATIREYHLSMVFHQELEVDL